MANKYDFLKRYYALIVSAIVFIIYLFTLAPSVIQIDAGELATVQKTLGIAHPTGYPLFTLAGYLLLQIPLPLSDIYKANLLSAMWCSAAIYLFIISAQLLLKKLSFDSGNTNRKTKTKHVKIVLPDQNEYIVILLPSILGGLLLAFSKTYWIQSTSVEVYPLQIFLFNLIIFTTLKAYFSQSNPIYTWVWVGISLAFGFANHMTTLLILPFVAILFFSKEKFNPSAFKKITVMVIVFIPILVMLYLFLPLRASANPEINWGNVINLENFWRHFTGKQYQVWLFSSFDSAEKQFSYFIKNLPTEFAYIGLIILIAGIFRSFRISKKIFSVLALTFLFAVLYSINYDITDIDSYFLLAYIMLGFFGVFGFRIILEWLKNKKGFVSAAVVSNIVLLTLIIINFSKTDQSDIYTFEDYTLAVLNNSEANSIIFSYQWDYFISPSYYFQFAEGIRKDVAVIDKELLRRSWYYNQLERNWPQVVKNIKPEIDAFITAVKPFERDENYNANIIEKNYRAVMTKLVSENIRHRNFYIGLELFQKEMQSGEFALPEGYQLVPHLLMFKVTGENDYLPAPDPNFKIRIPSNGNKYTENVKNFICTMLSYRALYELQFGKNDRAKIYVEKIQRDFPGFRIPLNLLQQIK